MCDRRKSILKSISTEESERETSHEVDHREPGLRNLEVKEALSTHLPVSNVGKRVEWPSLSEKDDDICFKEPRLTREIRFNTRLSEEEVRAEKAVESKHRRSGHLGELRKRASRLQNSLKNPEVIVGDLEVEEYNAAFRRFVDIHEVCMNLEDDEEKKVLMTDSYENQKHIKFQLDILLNRRNEKTPSESGFSRHSSRSGRSSRSSRSSVRERKRLEEAKLNIETLKRRQDIERQMEEMEKGKAELSRKIDLLEAETKVKQAAIDLVIEQCVENSELAQREESKIEDINKQLADLYNDPADLVEGSACQHDGTGLVTSGPSVTSAPLTQLICTKPRVAILERSDRQSLEQRAYTVSSSVRTDENVMSPHGNATNVSDVNTPYCDTSSYAMSTPKPFVTEPSTTQCNAFTTSSAATNNPPLQSTPVTFTTPYSAGAVLLNSAASNLQPSNSFPLQPTYTSRMSTTPYMHNAEASVFHPVNSYPLQSTPYNLPRLQEHSQIDAWSTIAQAIKQGPSLPKIELMKFSGDPLEYAEFVTNFKDNIESQVTEDSLRLTRLLAQCTGKAREAIRSCVNLPLGTRYKEAWQTLLDNFGQPHMIAEAHMKKLKEVQVRKADASSLLDFARRLEDARRVLNNMGLNYSCRLDNEDTIVALMRKLPEESLKRKWADKAGGLIKKKGRAEYKDFVDFVRNTADRINNRYGQELKASSTTVDKRDARSDKQDQRYKVTTLAAARNESSQHFSSTETVLPPKCSQCSGPHSIWRCWKFKSSTLNDRLKVVKQHNLCRACLEEGHFVKSCTKGFACRIAGCGESHHHLLHPSVHAESGGSNTSQRNDNRTPGNSDSNAPRNSFVRTSARTATARPGNQPSASAVSSSATTTTKSNKPVTVSTVGVSRPRVCFKVVPVKVSSRNSNKAVTTYAFFDSGSDASLCLESLIEELDVKDSKPTTYTMSTIDRQEEKSGHTVELNIESLSGDAKFCLENVLTTHSLPVLPKHVATNEDVSKWSHLIDLTLPETERKDVTILIGNDRPDIIDSQLEKREGNKGEPFAVKTPFGWTVYGPIEESTENHVYINLTSAEHKDLDEKLELLYDGDFQDAYSEKEGMSIEDRKAKRIMDMSATLVNGHYQLRLPFRQDPPNLPDSRPTAQKRLEWLKKRMEKDGSFKEKYAQVVEKYRTEGSSKEVPEEDVVKMKPIWYLPHHAVWHPRKPDEPRVVFDCAAKSKGISLNDQLLRGPENTSTLIGVILRFRVKEVAVAADVKRMFHQVFVAPEDRGALCYLWWPDGDITKDPKTYQMLVHIFGATSSPSVAGYALRKTAKDNKHEFSPDTIDAVLKDFYVDDLLKSFANVEEAIDISKQLQSLLTRGGFQLTKWISNDRDVLSAFSEEERAPAIKTLDLKSESLPVDRALGIHWDVEEDTFKLIASTKEFPETRKGVLSSIATVYDPLGFASPLILIGREINQELCRMKFDWNDDLPKDLLARWKEWREGLANLRDFKIPRCYKPKNFGTVTSAEIHHFADASQEHGYGTASYLRLTNDREEVHCSFIMGKSRVNPLKSTTTVPKLELTAATLLMRMNDLISKELEGRLNIDNTTYWTDSMIVLGYIANETKRFPTFVANRVAVIRQGSEPSQWKHVRTELNTADYASRGIRASETEKLERWRRGPEFLWKEKEEWPPQPLEMKDDEDAEEVSVGTVAVQTDFWNLLFYRYSTWNRLRRIVACLIRIVRKLKDIWSHPQDDEKQSSKKFLKSTEPLTVSDVKEAEKRIVMFVQRQSFSNADTKGKLARLKPFNEEGLIRVGGRLNRSQLDHDAKHPMILPAKHQVTELIILHYHHQSGHVGTHQVLAEIRQRYWIVNGVSSVKRVLHKCHVCKRQNAKMGEQITAPLPAIRVSSDEHQLIYPFSAVGLDYFGPLYVKMGPETRSSKRTPTLNKRYGCIFTCLRYRAVHIEVAQDLSSDSFMNAVLRFVSRRGPPRVIYSDNGTNFRGAELDVVKALKVWNQAEIQTKLNQKGIDWQFNPPAASHQGGVWERLIRSVRRILHSMIGPRLVNEETLRTFLTEVEKIMNDRPITRVSNDPQDLEALTPSHILLLRQNAALAPEQIDEAEKYKARWKHVHLLANEFWQRWTKEYLPTLQERQKWLDKKPNFRVGDLVLMADKNAPRGQWPKAIVEETFPDTDNVVRRVTVRTADAVYQRDVRKICLLEEELLKQIEEHVNKNADTKRQIKDSVK